MKTTSAKHSTSLGLVSRFPKYKIVDINKHLQVIQGDSNVGRKMSEDALCGGVFILMYTCYRM